MTLSTARRAAFGLLGLCLPLSIAASNIAWGLAGLACLATARREPALRRLPWTALEKTWLVYFVLSAASSLASADPAYSLRKLSGESLVLILLLARQFQTRDDARRNLGFFLSAAVFAGLWGLLQQTLGVNRAPSTGELFAPAWASRLPAAALDVLSQRDGRAVGFFNHPLTYAEMLLPAWTLCVAGAFRFPDRRAALFAAGGVVILGGILASESRGVWLALPILLLIWGVSRRKKRMFALLGALVLLAGLAILSRPDLRGRAESIYHFQTDGAGSTRLGLWRDSWEQIKQRPFLGTGIGRVRLVAGRGPEPERVWTECHSIYLQMVLERGVPGAAAFFAFFFLLGRTLWRAENAGPAPGLFFGFLGLLVAGATESWTHDSEVMMTFYFLTGCALTARSAADANEKS
ncbi:MAG: O-antigen ligase family protein [Elusimicrobiota bacterium]